VVCPFSSLNQSHWQSERLPQTRFLACHFAVVLFVIVSGEMKHRVQRENSDFLSRRVTQLPGITGRNFRGNGDIPGESAHHSRYRGER
jgi:hypothetical protein